MNCYRLNGRGQRLLERLAVGPGSRSCTEDQLVLDRGDGYVLQALWDDGLAAPADAWGELFRITPEGRSALDVLRGGESFTTGQETGGMRTNITTERDND